MADINDREHRESGREFRETGREHRETGRVSQGGRGHRADINVERKRPSIWPWIVGLLVLSLLIWAIAEMVDRDDVAQVEPAQEPAVPAPQPRAPEEAPTSLEQLDPLGPDDVGRRVNVSGAVVGQPAGNGFWILTDQDRVVFIQTDRPVVTGEHVQVTGTIDQNTSEESEQWFDEAGLREAVGWNVERALHVRAGEQAPAQPGMPEQPGEAPGQIPGEAPPGPEAEPNPPYEGPQGPGPQQMPPHGPEGPEPITPPQQPGAGPNTHN